MHTQLQNIELQLNLSNSHLKLLVEVAPPRQVAPTVNHSSTKWMFPKISSWLVLEQFESMSFSQMTIVGAGVNSSKTLKSYML